MAHGTRTIGTVTLNLLLQPVLSNFFDILKNEERGKYKVHLGSIYNCRFMPERIETVNARNEVVVEEGMHVPGTMTNIAPAYGVCAEFHQLIP